MIGFDSSPLARFALTGEKSLPVSAVRRPGASPSLKAGSGLKHYKIFVNQNPLKGISQPKSWEWIETFVHLRTA